MNKYPVYIISKGRWEKPLTANFFKKDGVDFKIAVEPQEYDAYCDSVGKKYVMKLDFANLGLGSYPARNACWEDSIKRGAERHWLFDDNIYRTRRYHKGFKIVCNSAKALNVIETFTDRYLNIGISGFNYSSFVVPASSDKKPFYLNTHVYSALLIKNNMPYRWRLKYNEDVDLCLQVLDNGLCTVAFNAFTIDKVSTSQKMKGGNQTELYQGNAFEKKVLKVRSLEEIWPQYVKTIKRFGRPHHHVDWKKYFHNKLQRRLDLDWDKIAEHTYDIKLVQNKKIEHRAVKDFYNRNK